MIGEIVIKDFNVLDGLMRGEYPEMLRIMAYEVISQIKKHKVIPVITESFREGDSGVHGCYRGLDFRTWELKSSEIEDILTDINSRFLYDKTRSEMKVLIYHDVGKGLHLHLQSHPNTVRV